MTSGPYTLHRLDVSYFSGKVAGAWEPLWRDGRIASQLHGEGETSVCRRHGRGARIPGSGRTTWNPPRSRRRHA